MLKFKETINQTIMSSMKIKNNYTKQPLTIEKKTCPYKKYKTHTVKIIKVI